MIDQLLTDELADRVLGWRLAPSRYLKSGRSWIPRSRFRPLVNLKDAFCLLDTASKDYCLLAEPSGVFTMEIRPVRRIGRATGQSLSRTITFGVARALGIEVPVDAAVLDSIRPRSHKAPSRSKADGI